MSTRFRDTLTVLLLVLFASTGLWFKSVTFVADSPNMRAMDREKIHRLLKQKGLRLVEQSTITAQGEYFALRYMAQSCKGGIDIVPLYRNSEGQHLLMTGEAAVKTAITFHGKIYSRFPSLQFWVRELGFALTILERPSLFSRALALREFGECELMELTVGITNLAQTTPK